MIMDKEVFKNKISALGTLVRNKGGYAADGGFDERVFRVDHKAKPCGDCGDMVVDRVITFELKWGYKDIPHWVKRCGICKEKTVLKKTSTK